MVKLKWFLSKILLQRIFLLGISGMIAYEILTGYLDYNRQVVEYMRNTIPYQQARESSKMKSNQRLSCDEAESSPRDQDAAGTEEHHE